MSYLVATIKYTYPNKDTQHDLTAQNIHTPLYHIMVGLCRADSF